MNKSSNSSSILQEIDRTIHAPARLLIMANLAVVAVADFTFLMHQTGLTRGNLSSHLGKLEESEYINITKEFVDKMPRTLIQITDKGKEAVQKYTENMQKVLDGLVD